MQEDKDNVVQQPATENTAPNVTPTVDKPVDFQSKLNELSQNIVNQREIIKTKHEENESIKQENKILTDMITESNNKIDALQKQMQELLAKQSNPTEQTYQDKPNNLVNDDRIDVLINKLAEIEKNSKLRETQEKISPVLDTLHNELGFTNEQINLFMEKTKEIGIDWTTNTSVNEKKELVKSLVPIIFKQNPIQNVGMFGGADNSVINSSRSIEYKQTQQDLDRQKTKLTNQIDKFSSMFGGHLKK